MPDVEYVLKFYKSKFRNQWRWKFSSVNGKRMANPGESFSDFGNALANAEAVLHTRLVSGKAVDRPNIRVEIP